jgi:hypothetical protein
MKLVLTKEVFMKMFFMSLLLPVLFFANSAMADDGGPDLDPGAVVEGKWKLVDRSCSSGYPVRDNFIFGRDQMTIEFNHHRYSAKTRIDYCTYWADGNYDVSDDVVFFSNIRGASDCGGYRPAPRQSVRYEVVGDELRFFARVGSPGPCPYGDFLENVFVRW